MSIDAYWLALHGSVFDETDIFSFQKKAWQTVRFEGNIWQNTEGLFLVKELSRVTGEDRVCVTDVELEPPHQFSCVFELDDESLRRAFTGALSHLVSHTFGSSGRWGAICTVDEEDCTIGYDRTLDIDTKAVFERAGASQRELGPPPDWWPLVDRVRLLPAR